MEIKYDKNIDAKYIRLKKGKVAYTKHDQPWLLFDYDNNGNVLGVEILDASEHFVSLSVSEGELFGIGVMELSKSDKRSDIESNFYLQEDKYSANNLCVVPDMM